MFVYKCLYQYSPMCTSYCFTCDRDCDDTTQESIMCMLEMPVLIQCTCEMYLSALTDWPLNLNVLSSHDVLMNIKREETTVL